MKGISARSASLVPLLVVLFLGVVAVILSGGILILIHEGKTPDAAIYTLAAGPIGALGALLANTAKESQRASDHTPAGTDAEPMKVANAEGQALEVKPEEAK